MINKTEAMNETTAKDFFLYLAFAVTLIWLVTSLLVSLFGLVNILVPDALDYANYFYTSGVSSSLASLIIITPFFLVISSFLNRDLQKNPEKKNMWVRKWLLYAVLFIAFIVVLTDLAMLLSSFLSGELSTRFALKSAAVFAVALATFGYFFFDLRRDISESKKIPLFSGIAVGVIVVAVTVFAFSMIGSPSHQRLQRLDQERVSDLSQLGWHIDMYVGEFDELPSELSALVDYVDDYLLDPVTGVPYEYKQVEEQSFLLCANFALSNESQDDRGVSLRSGLLSSGSYNLSGPTSWQHDAGEKCFEFTVREKSAKENLDHRSKKQVSEIIVPELVR